MQLQNQLKVDKGKGEELNGQLLALRADAGVLSDLVQRFTLLEEKFDSKEISREEYNNGKGCLEEEAQGLLVR